MRLISCLKKATDLTKMGDKGQLNKHQVKSKWYYVFWGIATIAVCSGQLYVGSGYREMAAQQRELTTSIEKLIKGYDPKFMRLLEIIKDVTMR